MAEAHESRAGEGDLEEESHWTRLAQKHWPKSVRTKKVKPDVIKKEMWDVLEEEGFQFRSLQQLENVQLLEKWVALNMEHPIAKSNPATFGLATLKIQPTITSSW